MNPDIFETVDSCGWSLKQLWTAVPKRCCFGVRIHWFCVDRRPIHVKKKCGFKNIQTFHNMEIKTDHVEEKFQDNISMLKK